MGLALYLDESVTWKSSQLQDCECVRRAVGGCEHKCVGDFDLESDWDPGV